MFEKLLSLLLQAKSGAVATVFVLGASGALVTATVNDGVATITVTPQESSTSGASTTTGNTTTTNSVEQAILALFNRTSAEEDPTSTATGKGCSDEAHERNKYMKRVNAAAKTNLDAVRDLGKDARDNDDAKQLVKDADTDIKDIRQAAVKAIHGTFDCDNDDEDATEDQDGDEDEDTGDEDNTSSTSTTSTTTTVTLDLTGDAEAIADLAIAAMEDVVAKLEADLGEPEDTDEEASATNTKQNGKSDDKGNKGKGNGKGRDR